MEHPKTKMRSSFDVKAILGSSFCVCSDLGFLTEEYLECFTWDDTGSLLLPLWDPDPGTDPNPQYYNWILTDKKGL